jgi:hydrogenase maturation protein HypF
MDRRAITIRGIVQGVGFRPFVYSLASRLGLGGFVRNQTGSVVIEVEGEPSFLEHFLTELTTRPPPLARIDEVLWKARPPRGEQRFRIEASEEDGGKIVFISPDVGTCDACLAELFDPTDRRYLYPFLNCTNCGPRLTIVRKVPYDRAHTTMAAFALCPRCLREYHDPADRRFHAQPTACPACGPRLAVLDAAGRPVETASPLTLVVAQLRQGRIVAVKGLGGYHLACVADRADVVAELRRRKHRDEKPFAVMVTDLAAAQRLCEVAPDERELLLSPRRPIVLLRKRLGVSVAEAVAPRNPSLGVLLPYTPLHHLLLRALDGVPLVLTSGNRSDEPIAFDDSDARARLAGIADYFLTHDRPIHLRCDDSVTRVVAGAELPIRRSRGYAPQPLPLPMACPVPMLALGGQLKATFALGRGRHAFLSHHLGDLDDYAAYRAYVEAIDHYERLFPVGPEVIVHDLHPDYASTRYAHGRRGQTGGLLTRAVQHHHAHMASCMAENGLNEPVIGVTFDGTGYGTDGAVWGGEFLTGDFRAFRRSAHWRYVPMPGGDQAIREPWRMALAYLTDAREDDSLLRDRVPAPARAVVHQMIERQFHTPLTSSVGRLFDGVAALAGVRDRVSYEGQAAMELEALATDVPPAGVYPFEVAETGAGDPAGTTLLIDTRRLIAAVAGEARSGVAPGIIGRRFHSTMVEIISDVCGRTRRQTGLGVVVLSGGVFLNALLLSEAVVGLTADGFRVYRHRLVPPNDGGLSYGQLAVAAAQAVATARSS